MDSLPDAVPANGTACVHQA